MASVNESGFLTDATGSRRFLPVNAQHIDISAAQGLDIDQVWAEAHALFRQGYRYWFNAAEIELYGNPVGESKTGNNRLPRSSARSNSRLSPVI